MSEASVEYGLSFRHVSLSSPSFPPTPTQPHLATCPRAATTVALPPCFEGHDNVVVEQVEETQELGVGYKDLDVVGGLRELGGGKDRVLPVRDL